MPKKTIVIPRKKSTQPAPVEETLDVEVTAESPSIPEAAVDADDSEFRTVDAPEPVEAKVTTTENLFRQLNPEQGPRRRPLVGRLDPDAPTEITMLGEVSAVIRIGNYNVADTLGLKVPVLVKGGVYVVPGVVAAVLVDRGHAAITG